VRVVAGDARTAIRLVSETERSLEAAARRTMWRARAIRCWWT